MPIQYINTGTAANKGNGDTLRVAFNKVNDNFRQLANPLALSKGTVGEVISNPAWQTGITVTYNTATEYATFALNTATLFQLGGIRVGPGLTINPTTGVLSAFGGSYNSLTDIPQPLGTTSSPSFNNIFAASIILNQRAVTVDNAGKLLVNSQPLLGTLQIAGSSISSLEPNGILPLQLISFNTTTRTAVELYPDYSAVLVTGDLSGRQPNAYNLGDDQNPWRGIWVGTSGINFNDGSSLTSANGLGGAGGASTSTLVNGIYRLSVGTTGTITLPSFADNTQIVSTSSISLTANSSTWTFGSTGTLTAPGDIIVNGTIRATAAAGTTATTSAGLGYIGMPQTSTATSYTLVASDQGKHIYITATAQTITIPANATVAFPVGTTISLMAGPSATSTTISITSDTMYLGGTGTTGNRTLAAYGMATLVKVSDTVWYINGSGLT